MAVDDANTDDRRETTERISPGAAPGWSLPCTVETYCREYRAPGEFPGRASVAA